MVHALSIWLLVPGFFGAGGLEILTAAPIALPLGHDAGLFLETIIIATALLTVLRHRSRAN